MLLIEWSPNESTRRPIPSMVAAGKTRETRWGEWVVLVRFYSLQQSQQMPCTVPFSKAPRHWALPYVHIGWGSHVDIALSKHTAAV